VWLVDGVVHDAGPLLNGVQRCRRCGLVLPLPSRGGGFEVGVLIEHVRSGSDEHMSAIV
jgi:hypothetical protein